MSPPRCSALSTAGSIPTSTWRTQYRRWKRGFDSLLLQAQALGELADAARRRVVVLPNNLYIVTGTEALSPEKATIVDCCQVLPRQYPNRVHYVIPTGRPLEDSTVVGWPETIVD